MKHGKPDRSNAVIGVKADCVDGKSGSSAVGSPMNNDTDGHSGSNHGEEEENTGLGQTYAQFQHPEMELPGFDGTEARSWIARVEQYFLAHGTLEPQRVKLAMIAMSGTAMSWFQLM